MMTRNTCAQDDYAAMQRLIRHHAEGNPDILRLGTYVLPCPNCQHGEAVRLNHGMCCLGCAALHDGQRVILPPTRRRRGMAWEFTLDIRDQIRNGSVRIIEKAQDAYNVRQEFLLTLITRADRIGHEEPKHE